MGKASRKNRGLRHGRVYNYLSRHAHIVTANAIHPNPTSTKNQPESKQQQTQNEKEKNNSNKQIANIFRDQDKFDEMKNVKIKRRVHVG